MAFYLSMSTYLEFSLFFLKEVSNSWKILNIYHMYQHVSVDETLCVKYMGFHKKDLCKINNTRIWLSYVSYFLEIFFFYYSTMVLT